jgi:hypothetical protein
MSDWSYDSLWEKTSMYMQRAFEEDRDGPMFPFWAALALEFLGRATLAKVHPALLADPKDGDNILYAFGFKATALPRSIPAKTVFVRCQAIIVEFSANETTKAMQLIELRNTELHSGTPAFEGHATGAWLPDYFRVAKLLLESQAQSLDDLLGKEEAAAALAMIDALEGKVLGDVKKRIAAAGKSFSSLPQTDRETAEDRAKRRAKTLGFSWRLPQFVSCPACNLPALMQGEAITESNPRMDDDSILVDTAVLPTEFECIGCGLTLSGYSELHAADLGGQYTLSRAYDPMEYYSDQGYFEEEYMND